MAMKETAQIGKLTCPGLIWLKKSLLRSWEFPFLVLFLSPIQGVARIHAFHRPEQLRAGLRQHHVDGFQIAIDDTLPVRGGRDRRSVRRGDS
jgi:hypothetical protein